MVKPPMEVAAATAPECKQCNLWSAHIAKKRHVCLMCERKRNAKLKDTQNNNPRTERATHRETGEQEKCKGSARKRVLSLFKFCLSSLSQPSVSPVTPCNISYPGDLDDLYHRHRRWFSFSSPDAYVTSHPTLTLLAATVFFGPVAVCLLQVRDVRSVFEFTAGRYHCLASVATHRH